MNPHGDGKPEPVDPEHLLRMLDVEMIQQRAMWKQAAARRSSLRTISFLFLFLIILGALLAAYFTFSLGWLDEARAHNNAPATPTPSVATRP